MEYDVRVISGVGYEMFSTRNGNGALRRDDFSQLQSSGNNFISSSLNNFGNEAQFTRFLGGEGSTCVSQFAHKRLISSYLREVRECSHIGSEPNIDFLVPKITSGAPSDERRYIGTLMEKEALEAA